MIGLGYPSLNDLLSGETGLASFTEVDSLLGASDGSSTSSTEGFHASPGWVDASIREGSGPGLSNVMSLKSTPSVGSSDSDISATPMITNAGAVVPHQVVAELINEQCVQKKRLARKAELARNSRKRKQMKMTELENEVEKLRAENQRLASLNAKLTEAARRSDLQHLEVEISSEQRDIQHSIESLILMSRNGPLDATQEAKVSGLIDALLNILTKRACSAKAHLMSLGSSLDPIMPLRFLSWAMNREESFYQDPNGLWNSLFVKELGLSEDQMREMHQFRKSVLEYRQSILNKGGAFLNLQCLVEAHLMRINENLQRLRRLLNPTQMAKFIVWVQQNELCVKMLESLKD